MPALRAFAIRIGLTAAFAAGCLAAAAPAFSQALPYAGPHPSVLQQNTVDADLYYEQAPDLHLLGPAPLSFQPWTLELLPDGLIYRSYLAGVHEPRISGVLLSEREQGWLLDVALGGRAGLIRYGTTNDAWPEGWQLDVEAAAFPRLDAEGDRGLISADFRFGLPLTYGQGPFQAKLAYYHLSSHLGDELLIARPAALAARLNFVRDVVVLGASYYVVPAVRLYGEAGYAFHIDGGAQPWEFQFGIDYSPPGPTPVWGAPFLAVNAHLRQELDFGGNFVAQAGWQWRGATGSTLRTGVHYLNGNSSQLEFLRTFEEQLGVGLWYDF